MDDKNKLEEGYFDYQITKDKRVLLYWYNKLVKTLSGTQAQKCIAQLESANDELEVQLVLARFTGNFKRGNER